MPAINATNLAMADQDTISRVAVSTQGVTKRIPAVRYETGEIVAWTAARFIDPTPPFPPFRRYTLRLLPCGEEVAYLHDLRETDERTYISRDSIHWSPEAALLPDADWPAAPARSLVGAATDLLAALLRGQSIGAPWRAPSAALM